MTLPFESYRDAVMIDKAFNVHDAVPATKAQISRIIDSLLDVLIPEAGPFPSLSTIKDKRQQLQALLTIRPPLALPDQFLADMDRLQAWEAGQKGLTEGERIPPISMELPKSGYPAADTCSLWQGDITTLKVDAIINAANSNLLGCFSPFHACIDNAIHTAAGPRLRQDCQKIMDLQGHAEQTGKAKITRGYHLPASYVCHTVGPIYAGSQTPVDVLVKQRAQLACCYRSCLDLAGQLDGIRTIAFCSISTGVFGFPRDLAARTAFETVAQWMAEHPGRIKVIFNLFSDSDLAVYRQIISGWQR